MTVETHCNASRYLEQIIMTNNKLKFIILMETHGNASLQTDDYTADLSTFQYFFDFFWKTFQCNRFCNTL